jgi:hypothetical protein
VLGLAPRLPDEARGAVDGAGDEDLAIRRVLDLRFVLHGRLTFSLRFKSATTRSRLSKRASQSLAGLNEFFFARHHRGFDARSRRHELLFLAERIHGMGAAHCGSLFGALYGLHGPLGGLLAEQERSRHRDDRIA